MLSGAVHVHVRVVHVFVHKNAYASARICICGYNKVKKEIYDRIEDLYHYTSVYQGVCKFQYFHKGNKYLRQAYKALINKDTTKTIAILKKNYNNNKVGRIGWDKAKEKMAI